MLAIGLVATTALCLVVFLSRKVRENRFWRATVTPLASIIGSGFLVVVPLLGHEVGIWAPVAMAGVVVLAYLVGHAIRFNIEFAEPRLHDGDPTLRRIEGLSDVALALSYFVSVAFYVRLLSSFALQGLGHDDELLARIVTTLILGAISVLGWFRGLAMLERLEQYSVSIKLSIIVALVLGWGVHDATLEGFVAPAGVVGTPFELARTLAGVLIVVQGFETSRYLGDEYDATTRIRSMRAAQLVSGVIYVVFVALCVPTMEFLPPQIDETAIIDLSGRVSWILPSMLVVAAVMSQFSAAVADTVGAGGLLEEQMRQWRPIKPRVGYAAVGVVAIALIWSADIFEIVALASRAFAFYYCLQCLLAGIVARHRERWALMAWFFTLATILCCATVIAKPAG